MTESSRPWWASDTHQQADPQGSAGRIDDVDPIEAFRSARRPRPVPPRAADHDPSPGATPPPEDQAGTGASPDGDEPWPHRPELCGICPLCTLARTLEDTRPELMGHLTEVARHLAAAARALMETPPPAADGGEHTDEASRATPARPRGRGVQRIPLEKRADDRAGPGPGGEG